jgi:hypothetical protein
MQKRLSLWLAAVLLILGSVTAQGYHETLYVTVNGVRMSPDQIRAIEQSLGIRAQSGHYWYNAASGYWGIVGGPALGRVQSQTGGGNSGYQGSQGGGTFRNYSDGSWGYRNPNTGTGMISDGQGGVWISDR